ncbi:hypothetical protein GOODEAATRI_033554 [Goodea atripinnis]|uniref:Uncharacterized protein n=1 Tax=Goodea atripinnis TaxID=208336 RepID=A0ABV0NQA1_9TELE
MQETQLHTHTLRFPSYDIQREFLRKPLPDPSRMDGQKETEQHGAAAAAVFHINVGNAAANHRTAFCLGRMCTLRYHGRSFYIFPVSHVVSEETRQRWIQQGSFLIG